MPKLLDRARDTARATSLDECGDDFRERDLPLMLVLAARGVGVQIPVRHGEALESGRDEVGVRHDLVADEI